MLYSPSPEVAARPYQSKSGLEAQWLYAAGAQLPRAGQRAAGELKSLLQFEDEMNFTALAIVKLPPPVGHVKGKAL